MRLSQLAPLPIRQAVWRGLELAVVPAARKLPRPASGPIVVAGMLTTANGIGESARTAYQALKASGLEPLAYDTSPILGQGDFAWNEPLIPRLPDTPDGLLIVYNNAPELGRILLYSGRRTRRDWCVASLWAWETANRPSGWIERAGLADELWFPSRFVQDAIAPGDRCRSLVAFHPVPEFTTDGPAELEGVSPGPLVFTCYADALSSFTRKNPTGAVQAFQRAFGDSKDVLLIVKTRNASGTPAAAMLSQAIGGASNILHIDRPFDSDEMAALRRRTDVLVSLHRSEGFGLTIAEAMRAGTPVIATNWSAPSEFVNEACGWLTPAKEIAVSDPARVYPGKGHTWADPDLHAAAAQMREALDPSLRLKKGLAGQARAATLFSADAFRAAVGL